MVSKRLILSTCLALGLAALGNRACAQLSFHVQVDTSNLTAGSTYYTEFTFSDGHVQSLATADTNNSVTLSNFTFGLGASGAVLSPLVGNAAGSTASSVLLADGDSGGVADEAQAFTPGSILGFDATVTTNADAGGTPDIFTFFILDSATNALPTNAPGSSPNAFVRLDITGPGITLSSVNTYGNSIVPVPAPAVTATSTATPEPGTLALGIGGSLGAALTARRRRAKKR